MFNVINVETGDFLLLADGTVAVFPDGKEAAVAAQVKSRTTGIKHKTQRIVELTDWRARELSRFDSGEYMPVAWVKDLWWKRENHPHHFAHVSKNNPKLVAFTESEEKGLADKQNVMKPGAYLKKYFGGVLSSIDIASLSAQHGAVYGDDTKMVITRDPAEIERVYRNGPSSCMAKGLRDFRSPFHPVRLYGEPGDLGLAYLLNDGSITARTVVWPEKKVYVRIYGDATRLQSFLGKEGYSCGTLEGARIPKIETSPEQYVVPYLDSVGAVDIDNDCLIIRNGGEMHCGTTDGLIRRAPLRNCGRCGIQLRQTSNNMRNVFTDETGAGHHSEQWCISCVDGNTYYCNGTGYLCSRIDKAITIGEQKYSPYYANRYMMKCMKTDAWFEKNRMYSVIVGYDERGRDLSEWWCVEAVEKFAFMDDSDGQYYTSDLRSTDFRFLCVKNAEKKMKRLAERKEKTLASATVQPAPTGPIYTATTVTQSAGFTSFSPYRPSGLYDPMDNPFRRR